MSDNPMNEVVLEAAHYLADKLEDYRNFIIEECAQVAEKGNTWDCRNAAAAIRALKGKP